MASFRANVSGAAPLRIQLTAPAGETVRIRAFTAGGDNTAGNAGRPVLFRPSSPGTGTGTGLAIDGTGVSPTSTVVTSFSVVPTDPTANVGAFNLPMEVHVRFPIAEAPMLEAGGTLVLYAGASGGHTWSGELEWEEGVA